MTTETVKFTTNQGEDLELMLGLKTIGDGSVGLVYNATCESNPGMRYALKFLNKEEDDIKKEFKEKSEFLSNENNPYNMPGFVKVLGFQNKIKRENGTTPGMLMEYGGTSLYDLIKNFDSLQQNNPAEFDNRTKDYLIDKTMYFLFLRLEELHEKGHTHNDLKLDNILLGFDINDSLVQKNLDLDLFEKQVLMADPIPGGSNKYPKSKELSSSKYSLSEDPLRKPFSLSPLSDWDNSSKKIITDYFATDIDSAIMVFMFLEKKEDAYGLASMGRYGEFLQDRLGLEFGPGGDQFTGVASRSNRNIPSAKQLRFALQEKIVKKYHQVSWVNNKEGGIIENIFRPIDEVRIKCTELNKKLDETPDYNHNDLENDVKKLIDTDYKNLIGWKKGDETISLEEKERMKSYLHSTIDSVSNWLEVRKNTFKTKESEHTTKKDRYIRNKGKTDASIKTYQSQLTEEKEKLVKLSNLVLGIAEDNNYHLNTRKSKFSFKDGGANPEVIDSIDNLNYQSTIDHIIGIKDKLHLSEKESESYGTKINQLTEKIASCGNNASEITDLMIYLRRNKK